MPFITWLLLQISFFSRQLHYGCPIC
jgi:hypothetical protein